MERQLVAPLQTQVAEKKLITINVVRKVAPSQPPPLYLLLETNHLSATAYDRLISVKPPFLVVSLPQLFVVNFGMETQSIANGVIKRGEIVQEQQQQPSFVFTDNNSEAAAMMMAAQEENNDAAGRKRTSYSEEQIAELEHAYYTNPYPLNETRIELARRLNVHDSKVKIWFQNRRARAKKRDCFPPFWMQDPKSLQLPTLNEAGGDGLSTVEQQQQVGSDSKPHFKWQRPSSTKLFAHMFNRPAMPHKFPVLNDNNSSTQPAATCSEGDGKPDQDFVDDDDDDTILYADFESGEFEQPLRPQQQVARKFFPRLHSPPPVQRLFVPQLLQQPLFKPTVVSCLDASNPSAHFIRPCHDELNDNNSQEWSYAPENSAYYVTTME